MPSLVKTKPVKLRIKKPMLTGLALVWLLTVDLLTRVPAGPVSLSGALTLAGAGLCLVLSPLILTVRNDRDQRREFQRGTPLVLTIFVAYAVIRLTVSPSSEGLQNVAVYTTFIGAIGLTAVQISSEASLIIARWMRYLGVIVSMAFLIGLVAGFDLYNERPYALVGLIFMAVLIPHRAKNRIYRLAPFFVAGVIAMSLSRTATIIALVMLIFLSVRGKRGFRLLLSALLAATAAGAAYWLLTYYAPFRDRFIGGDNATIGGIELNTSGRSILWEMTITSAGENPMFGNGPGSATDMISAAFVNISHPHNEYLRLFHDFGIVGASLFVVGTLALLARTLQRAQHSNNPIHWSAALGLLAVLAAALTDNIIVYPFVMVPLGLLVGASIGLPKEFREPTVRQARRPNLSTAYQRLQINEAKPALHS